MFYFAGIEQERGKEYGWEKQGRRAGGRAGKRPQQRKNRGGGTTLLRTFSKENSRRSGSIWTAHKGSFFSAGTTNKESPPETSNEQLAGNS